MGEHAPVPVPVPVRVRVRRVSGELRELRRRHGLAGEEVAGALGISVSKLSRMENGICKPAPDDVSALLGLYRVPAPRRSELLSLVREGQEYNWWRVQNGNMPAIAEDVVTFEKEATALQNYELAIVPGLLQTPEYTRAFTAMANEKLTAAAIDRLVEVRASRQQNWRRPEGPPLHVIMDESACRRSIGGAEVMHEQLRHIVRAARQSKLTVQVLPTTVVHPGLEGSFVVLDYDGEPSLVCTEHPFSAAFLEGTDIVSAAKDLFRRLRTFASSPEDSVDLIASIADELH